MANPSSYTPGYNFTAWQASNPARPLPAQHVDTELANIAAAVNNHVRAIQDVRRSDGKLANGIVTVESLSPGISPGFTLRGQWASATAYLAADSVVYGSYFYRANTSHTSSNTNRPDVDSATWTLLFGVADLAGVMSTATYDPTGVAADVFDRANHTGINTPSDGTVTAAKLGDAAVTEAKLANDSATLAKLADEVIARLVPTGTVCFFLRTGQPSGWVPVGRTIGSSASGAYYAAADAQALFDGLWAQFDNTTCPIFTSSGAPSVRGASAAADWAANKRLQAGILQGEFLRVWDDSRGVDPGRSMGTYQSSQNNAHTHGINDAGHAHSVIDPGHAHGNGLGSGAYLVVAAGGSGYTAGSVWASPGITSTPVTSTGVTGVSIQTAGTGVSIQSAGGNEARPRNVALLACVKL